MLVKNRYNFNVLFSLDPLIGFFVLQKYIDKFKLDLEQFNVVNEAYHKSLTKEQKMAIKQNKSDRRERLTKRRLTTVIIFPLLKSPLN